MQALPPPACRRCRMGRSRPCRPPTWQHRRHAIRRRRYKLGFPSAFGCRLVISRAPHIFSRAPRFVAFATGVGPPAWWRLHLLCPFGSHPLRNIRLRTPFILWTRLLSDHRGHVKTRVPSTSSSSSSSEGGGWGGAPSNFRRGMPSNGGTVNPSAHRSSVELALLRAPPRRVGYFKRDWGCTKRGCGWAGALVRGGWRVGCTLNGGEATGPEHRTPAAGVSDGRGAGCRHGALSNPSLVI